jgi:hypothetical protein
MPNFLENQSENTEFYEYFIDYTDWYTADAFFCEKCGVDISRFPHYQDFLRKITAYPAQSR